MKKFIKDNYITITIIIVTLFLAIAISIDYKVNYINNTEMTELLKVTCNKEENRNNEICLSFIEGGSDSSRHSDALTIFYKFIDESVFRYLSAFGIILVGVVVLHKLKYDEGAKYHLFRQDYKSYLKKYFKTAFSSTFIIPIILLILYIGSYSITKSFDFAEAVNESIPTFSVHFLSMGWKFFALLEFSVFVMSCIYVCFILISYKFVKNRYIALVLSFLLFIVNAIIINLMVETIITICLQIDCHSYLNLLNTLNFYDIPSIGIYIIIRIILFIIYFSTVLILYKNKEDYIIQFERMEETKK